jgi:hypothetical protein
MSQTQYRQLPNAAQLIRAARQLIDMHGSQAAAVAEKRATHLDECGENLPATIWREISDAVRTIEARVPPRHPVLAE